MSTQKLPDFGGVQLPAWLPIAPAQGGKAEPEEEEERAAQAGEMHEEDQQQQSGETDGLPSPSYAYPFKGISFVLQNSSLWATVLLSILGSIGVGFLIFIILMTGGLYPQVVLLGSVLNGGVRPKSLPISPQSPPNLPPISPQSPPNLPPISPQSLPPCKRFAANLPINLL